MEGGPPPCEGSQAVGHSAPCAQGLLEMLASRRLQSQGYQADQGACSTAPAWLEQAQDLCLRCTANPQPLWDMHLSVKPSYYATATLKSSLTQSVLIQWKDLADHTCMSSLSVTCAITPISCNICHPFAARTKAGLTPHWKRW